MNGKLCKYCGQLKDIDQFSPQKNMVGGRRNICRSCQSDYNRALRQRSNKHLMYNIAYSKTDKGKDVHKRACKKYLENNKDIAKAHEIVSSAIRSGILIPQPCEICGWPITEAHHQDYKEPLDVNWLCKLHHEKEHHKVIVRTEW